MEVILQIFKKNYLFIYLFLIPNLVLATGEPSTYFNIYVSPNNDNVRRDVALIVTAIYDSTDFVIIDDGMDGDTDDSNVTLLDQLPKELNLRTLRDVKSSHDFTFNVSAEGLFTAFFRDINLPDSTTNEELSNGFISFTISMNDDSLEGTEIINEAKIQFYYEDFIETNKVRNTLVYQLVKDELVVYPNPTTSNLNFQLLSSNGRYQEVRHNK